MSTPPPYRKDILGDPDKQPGASTPLVPAATVVMLRTRDHNVEVLMLQKTTGIAFGGMWVFPGGKIDPEDFAGNDNIFEAACNAAVRETREETGVALNKDDFTWFSHWTPPPSSPRRFSTWFFVAETDFRDRIIVDGGEILDHRWVTPGDALRKQAAGEIELAPPTWVTLYQLSQRDRVDRIIRHFENSQPLHFATRLERNPEGTPVAVWFGDAAYENGDLEAAGARHRLVLEKDGFRFENTVVDY
ncbi:MAG: NUDIX hydrolase [Ketobacteraceae bacterium]|nr:NUDIX hydrolase [Ketobacteraceae bacterium]